MPWWSKNPCWDDNYDGVSEPKDERQELTRNGETAADALTNKPEEKWNRGTWGWHNADYTDAQHAMAWEHTDVDEPISADVYDIMLDMDRKLKDGTYDPNQ